MNIVGRLRNNNDQDAEGADVYALAFTCEDIDYLDSKAESDARRARMDGASAAPTQPSAAPSKASNPSRRARTDRQPAHADA